MSEMVLDKEFEKMLDNMNLSDLKKEPLRRLEPHKKREMLTMHNKTNTRASVSSKHGLSRLLLVTYERLEMLQQNRFDSPGDYIYHLSRQNVSNVKKLNCIESLRVALTSNSLEWVQEFGNKGLKLLLGVIKECLGRFVNFTFSSVNLMKLIKSKAALLPVKNYTWSV